MQETLASSPSFYFSDRLLEPPPSFHHWGLLAMLYGPIRPLVHALKQLGVQARHLRTVGFAPIELLLQPGQLFFKWLRFATRFWSPRPVLFSERLVTSSSKIREEPLDQIPSPSIGFENSEW